MVSKCVFNSHELEGCEFGYQDGGEIESPREFCDSYKMESQVLSQEMMRVFQNEERRM